MLTHRPTSSDHLQVYKVTDVGITAKNLLILSKVIQAKSFSYYSTLFLQTML